MKLQEEDTMRHQLVTVITVSHGFVYPSKFILVVEIHCFRLLSVLDKLYRREKGACFL